MSKTEWNDAGSHVAGTGYADAAYPIYAALLRGGLVSKTHIEHDTPEIPGVGYSLRNTKFTNPITTPTANGTSCSFGNTLL